MTKFREYETLGTLLMNISSMRVESNENFKCFNQIIFTILNKIPTPSKPDDEVLREFYTKALPHSIAMWVKMAGKATPTETFDKSIKVEKELSILSTNLDSREKKDNQPPKRKKDIKLNTEGRKKE